MDCPWRAIRPNNGISKYEIRASPQQITSHIVQWKQQVLRFDGCRPLKKIGGSGNYGKEDPKRKDTDSSRLD